MLRPSVVHPLPTHGHYRRARAWHRQLKVEPVPAFRTGGAPVSSAHARNLVSAETVRNYVSVSAFVIVLTMAAAVLALWTVVRFPQLGPATLPGALLQVVIALAAGWVLVPPGMHSALAYRAPIGPLLAVFVFALPSLGYVFLASLWAMRVLQQMMGRARL